MTGLACGHRFCKGIHCFYQIIKQWVNCFSRLTECWVNYLTTKIIEEGQGQKISCAAHGCDILVDDQTVITLITEPKVKLRYQHLITNSFVEVFI